MWSDTALTRLLNIRYPIIQAPMAGGVTTPALVAQVSNAGGLGSLGAAYMKPEALLQAIQQIRVLTDKPFNVNLFIPQTYTTTEAQIKAVEAELAKKCSAFMQPVHLPNPPYVIPFAEQMEVVITEKVPVFSFTFGILSDDYLNRLKTNNTIIIGTATHQTEAQQLASKEVDAIVAQGSEAGGHRGTFIGAAQDALIKRANLLQQCIEVINKPIIAAGGIMDGHGIFSALEAGAAGVQMGTAFLSCDEANIPASYKALLLSSVQDNTVLTRAFSGKLARGLRNKFIDEFSNHQDKILDFPLQNVLTQAMRKEAVRQDLTDYMALWAGQSHYLCRALSVDALIDCLLNEIQTSQRRDL